MIIHDLNIPGTYTGVNYENNSPILVGDEVEFFWNNLFGNVKGIICFQNGSFVAKVLNTPLKNIVIVVNSTFTKINKNAK